MKKVGINGNNYYRKRFTIGYNSDGSRKEKIFYGKTKKEAEQKYLDWIENERLGINNKVVKESLSNNMYNWIWNVIHQSDLKVSTFKRYEGIYRNYVQDSNLGMFSLEDIQPIYIQKYYDQLFEDGKNYSQISYLNKVLKKYFNFCINNDFIKRNPCNNLSLNKYKDMSALITQKEKKYLTSEEIKIIFDNIDNEKLRIIFKFAVSTGLRQGELLALTKDDIIKENNNLYINVNKSLSKHKDKNNSYLTTPKTKSSVRYVPLHNSLQNDIILLDNIIKKEKKILGEFYKENNLLFPSEKGTYISSRYLLKCWTKVFDNLDIKYITFHDLRHTCATQLVDKGTDIHKVSKILGHSSVSTTGKYSHAIKNSLTEAVNQLDYF